MAPRMMSTMKSATEEMMLPATAHLARAASVPAAAVHRHTVRQASPSQ